MTNVGLAAVPLTMIESSYFAYPYIITLIVFCIAILASLAIFPSARKYWRRRNIALYAAFALIIFLLFFQIDNVSRRAMITYGFSAGNNRAYVGAVNHVTLSGENHGGRAARFYLVFSSVNASFQTQNQQDYILANSKTVKVPFVLSESGFSTNAASKPVLFTVDENVSGFSFSATLEPTGLGGLSVTSGFSSATYTWNATENCYAMEYASMFT